MVPEAKARTTCEQQGVRHVGVSARDGVNVDDAFLLVIKAALKRPHADAHIPDSLDLTPAPAAKKDSCAC